MGRGPAAAAAARPAPATSRRSSRSRRGHARVAPGRGHEAFGRRPSSAAGRGHAQSAPLPVRLWEAPFARTARARTSRALDALLSGRGWIALVFLLLAGIVFFNVDLLQMNRDIATNSERIAALKRENSRLLLDRARLATSERIQEEAAKLGLVLPAPGEVRYLKARPAVDARRAAKRITAPDSTIATPDPAATAPAAGATGALGAGGLDPATGLPVDPATGQPVYDPVTGAPLDPATGQPLDLSTLGAGATGTSTTGAGTGTTGTTATGAAAGTTGTDATDAVTDATGAATGATATDPATGQPVG
jgi:cell division protein FtsL